MVGKPIMTAGYVAANFAIKAGYFFVEALVLIFVVKADIPARSTNVRLRR
jgi:hypothetical protein